MFFFPYLNDPEMVKLTWFGQSHFLQWILSMIIFLFLFQMSSASDSLYFKKLSPWNKEIIVNPKIMKFSKNYWVKQDSLKVNTRD